MSRGILFCALLLPLLGGCALLERLAPRSEPVPPEAAKPVADIVPVSDRLREALVGGGLTVLNEPRGIVIRIPGPLFQFGSSDLTIEASEHLRFVASVVTERYVGRRQILVEGHTDSAGSAEYNLSLSQWRAEAVLDELVFSGVPPGRIEAAWYGETRPIAPNTREDGSDNPEGRAANRRVDIVVLEVSG